MHKKKGKRKFVRPLEFRKLSARRRISRGRRFDRNDFTTRLIFRDKRKSMRASVVTRRRKKRTWSLKHRRGEQRSFSQNQNPRLAGDSPIVLFAGMGDWRRADDAYTDFYNVLIGYLGRHAIGTTRKGIIAKPIVQSRADSRSIVKRGKSHG